MAYPTVISGRIWLRLFFVILTATLSKASPLQQAANSSVQQPQSGNDSSLQWRDVSIILDVNYQLPRLASDGLRFLGGHMVFHVAGNDLDGPLQVEIVRAGDFAIRVYDWGVANSQHSIAPNTTDGSTRRIYSVGQTHLKNSDFLDEETGNGAVMDVYRLQPGYISGSNSGIHFVRDLAWSLGLVGEPDLVHMFQLVEHYEQQPPLVQQDSLPLLLEKVTIWGDRGSNNVTIFDTSNFQDPGSASSNISLNDTAATFSQDPVLVVQSRPLPAAMEMYADTAESDEAIQRLRVPLPEPWDHTIRRDDSRLIKRGDDYLSPAYRIFGKDLPPMATSWVPQDPFKPMKTIYGFMDMESDHGPPRPIVHDVTPRPPTPQLVSNPPESGGKASALKSQAAVRIKPYSRGKRPEPKMRAEYLRLPWRSEPLDGGPDPHRWLRLNEVARLKAAGSKGLVDASWESSNGANSGPVGGPSTPDEQPPPFRTSGSGSPSSENNPNVCNRALGGKCGYVPLKEETAGPKSLSMARIGGFLSSVEVLETARFVGLAGIGAAAAFIVLDFTDGDWKGGAWGLASLLLGVAAVAVLEGPVGWIVAGFISLFAILPTLHSSSSKKLPRLDNAQEIIQYAMFGDASHTGNEKCREGTPEQPGNPNCTAVYGPGVIAKVFGWDNFDPVAYMLQFNDGYPMAIPEMASSFKIISAGFNDHEGDNQMATITCNLERTCIKWPHCQSNARGVCSKPKFSIKKNLITIPILNQTADKVYDRIIPNPGGDCKIFTDVGPYSYSEYNLTVTGGRVAIACNLPSTVVIPGTESLVNNSTANNESTAGMVAPANSSTDGISHAVTAPPPMAFAAPLNASNSLCLGGPGGSLCFPNGTYATQSGSLGFDSARAYTLTMPAGSSISYQARDNHGGTGRRPTWKLVKYSSNQTEAQQGFRGAMRQQSLIADPRTFDVVVPGPSPPLLCLYTEANYMGDVACYGVGSGDVPANMIDKAQSLMPHGGVTYWIYGGAYGDGGGQQFSSAVPDLEKVSYGNGGNWKEKVKALWIIDSRQL